MASSVIKKAIDSRITLQSVLNGDVLDIVKNMRDGIIFTATSNNPTNQPPGCSWGSYLFIKFGDRVTIFYADNAHIACAYSVQSISTSINWHVS